MHSCRCIYFCLICLLVLVFILLEKELNRRSKLFLKIKKKEKKRGSASPSARDRARPSRSPLPLPLPPPGPTSGPAPRAPLLLTEWAAAQLARAARAPARLPPPAADAWAPRVGPTVFFNLRPIRTGRAPPPRFPRKPAPRGSPRAINNAPRPPARPPPKTLA